MSRGKGTAGPRVVFLPSGTEGAARPGETLLALAGRLGVPLRHVCGGQANCTTCRVQVQEGAAGLSPAADRERHRLPDFRLESGWRLSCQARVLGSVVVRIPSLLERIQEAAELREEST